MKRIVVRAVLTAVLLSFVSFQPAQGQVLLGSCSATSSPASVFTSVSMWEGISPTCRVSTVPN